MAGWDRPAKLNRMQLEHLLTLDFLGSCTNVILLGPTGIGKTHLATALGHTACLAGYSVLFAAAIDVVNRLSVGQSICFQVIINFVALVGLFPAFSVVGAFW